MLNLVTLRLNGMIWCGFKIDSTFPDLKSANYQNLFKPRSTEEIEKILNEAWEDLEEFDENEQGFDNNDNVDIDIMDAIKEMGGIQVNLNQNAEKVC